MPPFSRRVCVIFAQISRLSRYFDVISVLYLRLSRYFRVISALFPLYVCGSGAISLFFASCYHLISAIFVLLSRFRGHFLGLFVPLQRYSSQEKGDFGPLLVLSSFILFNPRSVCSPFLVFSSLPSSFPPRSPSFSPLPSFFFLLPSVFFLLSCPFFPSFFFRSYRIFHLSSRFIFWYPGYCFVFLVFRIPFLVSCV